MSHWRKRGRSALVAFAVLLVVISFLPIWWTDLWWVRLWDFPRLQLAILLVLAGLGRLLLGPPFAPMEQVLLPLAGLGLALQARWILPFTPLWRVRVQPNAAGSWPTLSSRCSWSRPSGTSS